jgi:hypothetical protein
MLKEVEESFYRYFLYRLLDRILSEIRFEISTGSNNLKKIFMLSNFAVDLPLELSKFRSGEDSYKLIYEGYYEYSKRISLDKWFNDFYEETIEVYRIQMGNSNDISLG